jgi:hypothetical protein
MVNNLLSDKKKYEFASENLKIFETGLFHHITDTTNNIINISAATDASTSQVVIIVPPSLLPAANDLIETPSQGIRS